MPKSGAGLLILFGSFASVHVVRRMSSAWSRWDNPIPVLKHEASDVTTKKDTETSNNVHLVHDADALQTSALAACDDYKLKSLVEVFSLSGRLLGA
jgi:hypothetical protein